MASLSLPRVLQPRKTSLELERENFEKFQAVSISKAINSTESPVKEKHVRTTIMGTFHEKGGQTFWTYILRQPVQDDRIVAWKFCHVLHKVLREGHPQVLSHSQRHKKMLEDLGKLWIHLKEGYGKLIHLYTCLLITKLDFHRRNPRFPGNLQLSDEELVSIGDNDINNYFQLSVEMFDYMDVILNLQTAVFGSLDMSRSNSMTSCGQCRLAPLIPCIQDSSQLYDFCVKILFKLHASLPPDTLIGHRDRFLKQFRQLRQFYNSACTMQYFKTLVTPPILPENPPNFLEQSDLGSYATPVVILAPEEPQLDFTSEDSTSLTGDLVDVGTTSPDLLTERDNLIDHLQREIIRIKTEFTRVVQDYNGRIELLTNRIAELEAQVSQKDHELIQERQIKADLLLQTDAQYQEKEKKSKQTEDKFQKLKEVYTKLREEHIQLIRQKADVDKQLFGARAASEEAERVRADFASKLTAVSADKEVIIQQQTQIEQLQKEKEEIQLQIEAEMKTKDSVLAEKSQLIVNVSEAEEKCRALDVRIADLQQNIFLKEQTQAKELREILGCCVRESKENIRWAKEELDNPAMSAISCTPDYFRSLSDHVRKAISQLQTANGASKDNEASFIANLSAAVCNLALRTSTYVLYGKATGNASTDIDLGDRLTELCRSVANDAILTLESTLENTDIVDSNCCSITDRLDQITSLLDRLSVSSNPADVISDMIESELTQMDKVIEEAAAKIQEMLSNSRAADSGVKLEVNSKILDSCTKLMLAIRQLVQNARLLQAEIVAQGKGTASAKEFYKRNNKWTEGLISAAKAVALGANFLLSAADKAVSGEGKLEHLIVASQEIAAGTAQLVVASRVKADRDSKNLSGLSQASKAVAQATAAVVATAKDCAQLVQEAEDVDVSGLTLHAAKRLEMEAQVRALELEVALQSTRVRLAALRKHHYRLAGEQEGWDQEQTQG